MKISSKSQWDESEIRRFLNNATIPMRLSFMNKNGEPMICSLWFKFIDDSLWSASHQNAYVVNQLKNNSKVSFEISTNEYPEPLAKGALRGGFFAAGGKGGGCGRPFLA